MDNLEEPVTPTGPVDQLILAVAETEVGLAVSIRNPTDSQIRIWSRDCSWGRYMLTLEAVRDEIRQVLTPAPMVFTRNFPRWVDLDPGEELSLVLTAGDPEWQFSDDLPPLDAASFELTATLTIHHSEQADNHDVALGTSSSEPISVDPPHPWLDSTESSNSDL